MSEFNILIHFVSNFTLFTIHHFIQVSAHHVRSNYSDHHIIFTDILTATELAGQTIKKLAVQELSITIRLLGHLYGASDHR